MFADLDDIEYIALSATNTPTEEEMNSAKPAGYKQYMQSAATLVLSTKVSWWMTNHHVGQGKGFQSNIHLRTRSN